LLASIPGCAFIGPTFPGDGSETDDVAREIEEADIIKLQDGHFYISNPFTGLRIIDVTDIDNPELKGRTPLGGRAVELFVRDDLAFVLTSADQLSCAVASVGIGSDELEESQSPDFAGSRIWVVNIADKDRPAVETVFDFNGFVTATRRVGDVIYAAGNFNRSLADTGVFVKSINIADPENIFTVETAEFPGQSLDVHVTTEAMFVFGDDPTLDETTLVSYVDISDPAGDIAIRDQFRVPGLVGNRFFVDAYENVLRLVTDEFVSPTFTLVVALYTYDVSDPDDVQRLARLPIVTDEGLRSVRFDGTRGYAVTFRFVDPLFVVDLTDPAAPKVTGQLEVPGFSTHLVPLNDRLVGVGFDNTAGVRPAVALYDVSDPADPRLMSRIVLGERFDYTTTSEATVDHKALRVIEEAGLILLPVTTFDRETAVFDDWLQFVEMSATRLTERGDVGHAGVVRRADLLNERIWMISDQAFQTVDPANLDEPVSSAVLDLVTDQELLDSGLAGCVAEERDAATSINFSITTTGCGGTGVFFMILMALGWCGLKFVAWRM